MSETLTGYRVRLSEPDGSNAHDAPATLTREMTDSLGGWAIVSARWEVAPFDVLPTMLTVYDPKGRIIKEMDLLAHLGSRVKVRHDFPFILEQRLVVTP